MRCFFRLELLDLGVNEGSFLIRSRLLDRFLKLCFALSEIDGI